ncbi:MAG: tRNA uridine-5-carboxymethylaminomethyl(34) synthesis GTPase MnmE [Flavobacteriales bacterium]|nr:tRNA uridine-5-carboxymethylaminomethyl(34) synthesis GTPase MnmE [Flavobacteriales bacterium]
MKKDNICALATASGLGAIAIIRVSGPDAIVLCDPLFESKKKGKRLSDQSSHTVHLGTFVKDGHLIDEVLVTVFKGPHSYTGENVVEISCHGSTFIQHQIIQALLNQGCRTAEAGEFTFRAFMNGKMDLSQAEAVADLISSSNEKSHHLALSQMRGGFSGEIQALREELIKFASLIELELDFSTEDVEFADRSQLQGLLNRLKQVLRKLIDSFALGNVLKNGIPVAIVGEPNVGKSTLLNALLNEERAIVSEIAGTTRDTVEDEIVIEGMSFRFIDTAGIRDTQDQIESIGIEKTFEKINQAKVVLYLFDASSASYEKVSEELTKLKRSAEGKQLIAIANKVDRGDAAQIKTTFGDLDQVLFISAKEKANVDRLKVLLTEKVKQGLLSNDDVIVSNSRHYEALSQALNHVVQVQEGLASDISGDLLAMDIRQSLFHLGEITGEITTDDLLDSIFRDFCIGK